MSHRSTSAKNCSRVFSHPALISEEVFKRFRARLRYFRGNLDDAKAFVRLKQFIDDDSMPDNLVFYMAIRPAEFGSVSEYLAASGLNVETGGWRRLVQRVVPRR